VLKVEKEINLDSTWQCHTVEIMKTLHGFDDPEVNKNINAIDFTIDGKKKKMLRILLERGKQTKYSHLVKQTIMDAEELDIDETIIVSDRLTAGAKSIINNEDSLSYITPKTFNPFSIHELKTVMNEKLVKICEKTCGSDRDTHNCNGLMKDGQVCSIYLISKNAAFHAKMKWSELLHEDLNQLISYQTSDKIEVVN